MRPMLEHAEENILLETIHMGAQNGVSNVSSKKLAKACGIATATIFLRFQTMQNVLDSAAQYFDRKHMSKIIAMSGENKSVVEMWDYFMDCLMEDPDGSLYYSSYTSTFGFDPTTNNPRAQEFLEIAKAFFHTDKLLSDTEYLLIWDYITSMAFYYSEKFLHYMPYTEENKEIVRNIVFKGLDNIIG